MSMNICITAEAKVTMHLSTGDRTSWVTEHCSVCQTPTVVTESIMKYTSTESRLEAYFEWIRKTASSKAASRQHISQVQEWVSNHTGWEISIGEE